jgi:hypothetical protein
MAVNGLNRLMPRYVFRYYPAFQPKNLYSERKMAAPGAGASLFPSRK